MADFTPGKNFEAILYREALGLGSRKRGKLGRGVGAIVSSRKPDTNLIEIAEDITDLAMKIAASEPALPRSKGGLRSARGNTPRASYAFRREREGQRRYYNAFTEPKVVITGNRVAAVVFNLSPAADLVEAGTGNEGQAIRPKRKRSLQIPIKQSTYNRLNDKMTLSERRKRGLISGDREYRKYAKRQSRLINTDLSKRRIKASRRTRIARGGKAIYGFGETERGAKKAARLKLARREQDLEFGRKRRRAISNQFRGYEKRFSYIEEGGVRVGRSRSFYIKRNTAVINRGGRAYLYTDRASRYAKYGILARALREAVKRL